MRVLKWIIDRCEGRGGAEKSPIGHLPRATELDLEDLEGISSEELKELLAVKPNEWSKELAAQKAFFQSLQPNVPPELLAQEEEVERRFR
jgi:phosphoenolpyruvate carboxykinase (GTP)